MMGADLFQTHGDFEKLSKKLNDFQLATVASEALFVFFSHIHDNSGGYLETAGGEGDLHGFLEGFQGQVWKLRFHAVMHRYSARQVSGIELFLFILALGVLVEMPGLLWRWGLPYVEVRREYRRLLGLWEDL